MIYHFHCSDANFLKTHSILSNQKSIKLFVRVKERIIPNQCSFKVTGTFIEITLIKENQNGARWGRLEPNEYSEVCPPVQQTSPPTPPSSPNSIQSTSLNSTIVNSNKGNIKI